MALIELPVTEIDDPSFVSLVSSFLSHYAETCHYRNIKVIQIDNWFGERWLGFAGKYKGIAGIRNRSLHSTLPAPPFRPSRVISAHDFSRDKDGAYIREPGGLRFIHAEKNGGVIWELYRPGLYCWYSGNTAQNTTASLMVYEVTRIGSNAWYISFDQRGTWGFTKCRNVTPEECMKILNSHRKSVAIVENQ